MAAPTTKRLKVDYNCDMPLLANLPQFSNLPIEFWKIIGSFLSIKQTHQLSLVNKKLYQIPFFKLNLSSEGQKITTHGSHPRNQVQINISQTVTLLNQNRVDSIVFVDQAHIPSDLLVAFTNNQSCRHLDATCKTFKKTTKENESKFSAFSTKIMFFTSNKKLLKTLKISCFRPEGVNSFSISKESMDSLFENPIRSPLETLQLMIENDGEIASKSLATYLSRFNNLKYLSINGKLGYDFWKALKNHPQIESLEFPSCELASNVIKKDQGTIIGDAISSLPMLQSLIMDIKNGKENLQYSFLPIAKAFPQKLKKFHISANEARSLSDLHVSVFAQELFFQKIGRPASPIRELFILNDPNVYDYLENAPWETVFSEVTIETIDKLKKLKNRKKPITLCLASDQTVYATALKIFTLFPDCIYAYPVPGPNGYYFSFALLKQKINLLLTAPRLE